MGVRRVRCVFNLILIYRFDPVLCVIRIQRCCRVYIVLSPFKRRCRLLATNQVTIIIELLLLLEPCTFLTTDNVCRWRTDFS